MSLSSRHFFVSDLHMFARRSHADRHVSLIREQAQQAKAFVLAGDIFDFTWTTRETVEETIGEAAEWLRSLASSAPGCQFYFVPGNHDHHDGFVEHLHDLADTVDNFDWHPYFVRLGNTLFLHGDAAENKKTSLGEIDTYRRRWGHNNTKHGMLHWLYDVVVALRIHRLIPALVYRNKVVVRRLMRYLQAIGHGPDSGVEHVCFGHTHVPLAGYEHNGVQFHNGGAPLRGTPFRIMEAPVQMATA